MKTNWRWKRFGKAWKIFSAVMRGKEYVPRSSVANEELIEFPHPDGPSGCTREEIYYDSSIFGTGAHVPFRPIHQSWTCTKCKQPVKLEWEKMTFGGQPNGEQGFNATCPCGQVDEHVDSRAENQTLVSLRNEKKIY